MVNEISKWLKKRQFLFLFMQLVVVLFLANMIAYLVYPLWTKYNGVFHSLLELICIVLAVTTFLIVWCRYYSNSVGNQIVALGFLAIAVFDLLHAFYFATFGFSPKDYLDLSDRFWIISRITEAFLLLIITVNFEGIKINKWLGLLLSFIYSISVSCLIYFHKNLFPILYTSNGVTDVKIALEYFIILILIFSLWNLRKKINITDTFTYKYIALAIILFIPAELCFTTYKSLTAYAATYGHVLKIAYYICLFKGIVDREINYPYIKLEEVNKQLKDILNAIPLGIHTYDEKMKLTFANKRFEELLQCKLQDLAGLTIAEVLTIIKKVDMESENKLPDSLIKDGISIKNIVRTYITQEGNLVKLLVDIHKIDNGIMFVSSEATREQAIENLNLQTETILNSMQQPAMILDNKGIITACNTAFENLVDIMKSDLVGASLLDINNAIKFNNKQITDKYFSGSLNDEYYEGALISMKGIKKEIIGHVSSIYNVKNEKIGIISVMQDVTEMRSNQEKLINQEKLALLGQMGATIVHDTRNFLTTINGCSQLIELYSEDNKIKEYAKKIKMDTDEVNRIISDFLTLAKPANILVEEISIKDLLLSMKRVLQTSSLIKGIDVEFDFRHDERYIMCDQVRLRQVILNICKNAIEAMEGVKQPCLKIETGIEEAANEVYIRITDNGTGIPKEMLPRLGTPFLTTKKNGTGLGLNACFQIVKEHSGRIEVESDLKSGTTFNIILPCISDEEDIG